MRIFAEGELRNHLEERLHDMQRAVLAEGTNQLLNVNELDYVEFLVSQYCVEPLVLHQHLLHVTAREEMIQANRFPRDFDVRDGAAYSKQVVTYHLPFSGQSRLLSLTPSTSIMWSTNVQIQGGEILFDIVNWRNDPEEIKREAAENLRNIERQASYIAREVDAYNSVLQQRATECISARKQVLLKQANLLERLGVPFKTRKEVPETFAIPALQKKAIISKPSAPVSPYTPEPALDDATYRQILKLCQGTGTEIERHPGIYEGKDEETMRDHFIMVLSPHFDSVTGETFNKAGKTDILIRYEGMNAFVAECKYWRGSKQHSETIDQVLSYLTWRDSKAAILYFVKSKNLDPVLKQISEETPKHPAFVEHMGMPAEGWHDYRFHLLKDNTRNVYLAVLCFHFPQKS